jgi:glycosyltransferase involved in cell wall biosynthesis
MDKKIKLSVIIIAKNEEEKIRDCLMSVAWADEVIVIDNYSLDSTFQISKKLGARAYKFKDGSYSDLRNYGLSHARGEWVLYVDADERVTDDLRDEIKRLLHSKRLKFVAYAVGRRNIVLGHELKHGGFGENDFVKRLFKRSSLIGWKGELHEEPEFNFDGKITTGRSDELGYLENRMIHIKAQRITEMVEKTNRWSEIEARLMYDSGHPQMNIARLCSAMFREFWSRIVLQKAYLDGTVGFVHGIYQVFSRFLSYAKLWEMQDRIGPKPKIS